MTRHPSLVLPRPPVAVTSTASGTFGVGGPWAPAGTASWYRPWLTVGAGSDNEERRGSEAARTRERDRSCLATRLTGAVWIIQWKQSREEDSARQQSLISSSRAPHRSRGEVSARRPLLHCAQRTHGSPLPPHSTDLKSPTPNLSRNAVRNIDSNARRTSRSHRHLGAPLFTTISLALALSQSLAACMMAGSVNSVDGHASCGERNRRC